MGKIFNAIEKHIRESKNNISDVGLKDKDLHALMSYDRHTGKLDIDDLNTVSDPDIVERLIQNKLILPNGKITTEGKKKYEEFIFKLRLKMAGPIEDYRDDQTHSESELHSKTKSSKVVRELFAEKDKESEHQINESGQKIEEEFFEINEDAYKGQAEQLPETEDKKTEHVEPVKKSTKIYADADESLRFDISKAKYISSERHINPIDKNLITLLESQSYEAEQFKILRSNILFPHSGKAPRTILITSANQAEGKSFVAANLAVCIASNINQHVLLMDCDMRNPTVHRIFGFDNKIGLSNYLQGELSIDDFLLRTKVERLSLLPAGMAPLNPSELVSSQKMSDLITEVSERYDDRIIIIDSPPPTLTAETTVLSRNVDGIIVVVRYGKTSSRSIKSLIESIGKGKIIGSVINRFEYTVTDYYQGYGAYRKYGAYRNRGSL